MKRIVALIVGIAWGTCAHAGFVGAFVGGAAGAAMASNGSVAAPTAVISSDRGDVIVCCATASMEVNGNPMMCSRRGSDVTPERFAELAGYKTLFKRGFLSRDKGCDLIIMEVGKY